ncbi:hypothetical protein BSIN_3171 [Burkholderia singularis]|uniref:Uncharacterized protein n=1 Tax=Burkholderia singularis TaxID=1503053 RepID=A0A238H426_9BURK|nr:hypothetical protein BSIN_3171 [Burkholderia singularis]
MGARRAHDATDSRGAESAVSFAGRPLHVSRVVTPVSVRVCAAHRRACTRSGARRPCRNRRAAVVFRP